MFTGIIQATGAIRQRQRSGTDAVFEIDAADLPLGEAGLGDSIAVNGVCLTAVNLSAGSFRVDVSAETLACTTLGDLDIASPVNLEMALTLSTPLGGHLVSGHVDGMGTVVSIHEEDRSARYRFRAPVELARYIARKGSITIDGVSLTVNAVAGEEFDVQIIPHTRANTNIRTYRPGMRVNLEVDIIARYLERLLSAGAGSGDGLDKAVLERAGFIPRG